MILDGIRASTLLNKAWRRKTGKTELNQEILRNWNARKQSEGFMSRGIQKQLNHRSLVPALNGMDSSA